MHVFEFEKLKTCNKYLNVAILAEVVKADVLMAKAKTMTMTMLILYMTIIYKLK